LRYVGIAIALSTMESESMGLLLIVAGLLLWLLAGWFVVGIILIVIGIALLFVPNTYGYSDYRGRRAP
jgi:putative exporter of polyketide antibiotics